MDTAWTFTIPMPILIGLPASVAVAVVVGVGRKWWKKRSIRVAEQRRVRREEAERIRERRTRENEERRRQDKEAADKKMRDALPNMWASLYVALREMPKPLQMVWFQQCLREKIYPPLSVEGAKYFLDHFEHHHSREKRDMAAEAMGPWLDIGSRLSSFIAEW